MHLLSQTAEYALRAVVCLAQHPQAPMTTQQIAQRTRVPAGYLAKVLQTLGRAGLVSAQRGLHGGFCLMPPPEQLTVLHVVQAVAPVQRIHRCPLGLESHGTCLCPLHRQLDNAMLLIEQALGQSTIADLLKVASPSRPLGDEA